MDRGDAPISLASPWISPQRLAQAVSNTRARPLSDVLGGWCGLEAALGLEPDRIARGVPSSSLELRRAHFGLNYVAPPAPRSLLSLMLHAAFMDRTNLMLLCAGLVSLLLGVAVGDHPATDWVEGTCVLVAVLAIVLVTALTEWKKDNQFQELNAVKNNPLVHVVRDDGTALEIRKWDIVVGDVVVLHTGDVVPADGVLLSSRELRVDESAMTGEAEPVGKHWDSEKRNVVLGGTTVVQGSGSMLVLCVGDHTQEGMVLSVVHDRGPKTAKSVHASEKLLDADLSGYAAVRSPRQSPEAVETEEVDDEQHALDRTPLALKLEQLNLTMGKIGAVISVLLFVTLSIKFSIQEFVLDKHTWSSRALGEYVNFFILSVTTLVVAIPEGLPLAVIIALTYSVRQMLKEKSLVRHLYACETAGNATIICTDKTGTLTTNQMTVAAVWLNETQEEIVTAMGLAVRVGDAKMLELLMRSMAINSSAELLQTDGDLDAAVGSPTECALLRFVRDAGFDYQDLRDQGEIVRVVPFSSDRKCMTTVVKTGLSSRTLVLTKGAPENVLSRCVAWCPDGSTHVASSLGNEDKTIILSSVVARYASRGCRTLCLAYKEILDGETKAESMESGLTLLAILAIEDPIRPEVPQAIAMCKSAGVAVCIVTGDNILTATSIAKQCGILNDGDEGQEGTAADAIHHLEQGHESAMDASEFRARVTDEHGNLQQDAFDAIWPSLCVLARATPLDKQVLVSGLMASRHDPQLVAVTGDGTNDAAALKTAHVGFAMGQGGTEVAKRASDIVVLDDNFLSIVNAIKWGRNVYDSIAKFLQFQLTMIFVAVTMATGSALFMESPALTAVQILWINLFMDAFVSLGLATETPTDRVMQRKPYKLDAPLLSLRMRKHIGGQYALQLLVLIARATVDWPFPTDGEAATGSGNELPNVRSTMVFNTFAWMQLFNQINCRRIDDELNVLAGLMQNRVFMAGWSLQALLQWVAIQYGGTLFHCVALSADQWCVCLGLAALTLPWGLLLRLLPSK